MGPAQLVSSHLGFSWDCSQMSAPSLGWQLVLAAVRMLSCGCLRSAHTWHCLPVPGQWTSYMKDGFLQGQSLKGPRLKLRDLFCPNFGSHTASWAKQSQVCLGSRGRDLGPNFFYVKVSKNWGPYF